MVLPVGEVGGELPIPISLRVNGKFSTQAAVRQIYSPGDPREPPPLNDPYWYSGGTTDVVRPVYGTVHLGYIVPCSRFDGPVNTEFVVLEDGTIFRTADFVSFSNWYSSFTLPQDFGFNAKDPSQVLVTNLGSHALYSVAAIELGSIWQAKVKGLTPLGFGVIQDSYRVLMDKDRARIFVRLPDLDMWVPILWVDRFNHWVSLKWQRNTSGLPAGITATYALEVRNHRDKGVALTWADFVGQNEIQDLLRADFIGMNAPCILVRGYPGVASTRPASLPGANPLVLATVKVAGPVGRPTSVQIGESVEVPQCSWSPNAPPVSGPGLQPVSPGAGGVLRTWTFEYEEPSRAVIKSMTDAMGVCTTYSYGGITIPTTQSVGYQEVVNDELSEYTLGVLTVYGVEKTLAYDSISRKTLSRSWVRGTADTGEPNVISRETFGDLDSCSRWTEVLFSKSTDANGRDYGNGALTEYRLWEKGISEPITSVKYSLDGAGLDNSYTYRSGMVIKKLGEPIRTVAYGPGILNLMSAAESHYVGSGNARVKKIETTYREKRDKLDWKLPSKVQVVQSGTLPEFGSTSIWTYTDYNAKGLPERVYRAVAGVQRGSSYSYDDEGRVTSQKLIPEDALSASVSNGYDPTSGLLATQVTSYLPDGGSSLATLTRRFSDFDSAGHPQTMTDERGLITKQIFDGLGRVVEAQNPTGPVVKITYPKVTQRIVTQGALSVTEEMDGFGRLIKRIQADGSWEEFTYDDFGRVWTRRKYSRLGTQQGPSVMLYDALDRPRTITSPGGACQTITYSVDPAFPNYSLMTKILNTPKVLAVTKEYRDGLGQLVRVESPKGDVTESIFDGAGNLRRVVLTPGIGGKAQIREFLYDEWGRMTQRSEPETGTTLFQNFNWAGKPTQITEADNRVRVLAYDGLNRLVRMESGKEKVVYTFSGLDLLGMSSVSDGIEVKQRFEYNGIGKQLSLEETTQPGLTSRISYTYDQITGLLKSVTYPAGGTVEYGRDGFARIQNIKYNGSDLVSQVDFDEWGNRQRLSFASGAYSDWVSKDSGIHLDQWNIGHKNELIDGTRFYQYDSAERLTMAGDWDKLEHDEQGRLLTANSSLLGINTSHGHDAYGNNIKHIPTGNVNINAMNGFEFGPLPDNRLPGETTGWVLNARGEAMQIGATTGPTACMGIGWDGMGRLKAVSYNGGTQSFVYAPSGMRVSLIDNSSSLNNRRYAYTSSGMLLSEYGESLPVSKARSMASVSTTADSQLTNGVQKTSGGLAYRLPSQPQQEATAWIDAPLGPTTVMVGQALQFQGGSDFGSSFRWTFGDGTTASKAVTTKIFDAVGTYNVVFQASGPLLKPSTATVQITVVPSGPMIGSFAGNVGAIGEGSSVSLSWSVSGATSVSITGIGNVSATSSATVSPTSTTTYTLTATGSGKTVTSSIVITVVPAPVIRFFVPEPVSIQPGQVTTLKWGVDNATSYELDQGIGGTKGSWVQVWPGSTMTFRLTAINQVNGIVVRRTVTTTVTVGSASNAVWKRDVVYLGSEAVAEIDADGVHELHNDHLGSPLVITRGATAQIEGRQVFGPYGELVKSEGYIPLTGYTGHLRQDATGLIYMRGRFYSPAWHRFLNSDQGVDPLSWNQMAYVGGSPFHAKDPSGLSYTCIRLTIEFYHGDESVPYRVYNAGYIACWESGGGSYEKGEVVTSGGGGGGGAPSSQQTPKKTPCPPQFKAVVNAYKAMFAGVSSRNNSIDPGNPNMWEREGVVYRNQNGTYGFAGFVVGSVRTQIQFSESSRALGMVPSGATPVMFVHNHPNDQPGWILRNGSYVQGLNFSGGDMDASLPITVATRNSFNNQQILYNTGNGFNPSTPIPKECF